MEFLIGLFQIMIIDLVLSGDNAIVIALASRKLPADQQKKAIIWGTGGAIVLRLLLTTIAVWLLKIPFLMIAGGLLLIWISLKLLIDKEEELNVEAGNNLFQAIRIIIIADFVMSLDNVLGVAGAAKGNYLLLIVGILLSIPIMVWGSSIILRFMERYPAIIYLGSGILAWTAGEMIVGDEHVNNLLHGIPGNHYGIPLLITIVVLAIGYQIQRRNRDSFKQEGVSNTP
jgi:YjbE family integral membrane protein